MSAEEEPCGSEEKQRFLDKYDDVNNFVQHALKSVLQATKSSNEMPAAGDDYDFYSSYSGFQDAMNIEGKRILHMIQSILKHQNVKINLDSSGGGAADIDDKVDLLMDANDQILERVGQWLDEASGIKKQDDTLIIASATAKQSKQFTTASWNKKNPGNQTSFRLLSARNIQRPQMKFKDKIDNSNLPFRPFLKHKFHAKMSLEDSLQLPDGVTPEKTEDPKFVYPHPYQFELDNIEYLPEQLEGVKPRQPGTLEETPCIYVESEDALKKMVQHLKKQKEIAVDLEAHDYRSFQGFLCLMQISTRDTDYLVDTLALRSELHIINEVFTDPSIIKVLHGADHDICWLMRDLGVYVVNMFDTGQAAGLLNFPRRSLAHLLQHFCNVTADKKYQLADWRIRPLPELMVKYAREDTHYLLYIYDMMKNELLERGNENKNLLQSVLQKSVVICSKVNKKQMFTETSYMNVVRNKGMFNSQQNKALRDLYAWRDQTARLEDESTGYILPNHMLIQICDILPKDRNGVLACCNPVPPLVRQYLPEIHVIIMKAREAPINKRATTPKVKRPTQYQHPKYNVDGLLNCPHDLSHIHSDMTGDELTTLLDSSLIAKQSAVYPDLSEPASDIIVLKQHPLLSVFDYSKLTCVKDRQKKAAEINAQFSSPYIKFMPDVNLSPSNKRKSNSSHGGAENWKLKPVSSKAKEQELKDKHKPTPSGPPAKKSKTDLHSEVSRHVRFDDDDDEVEEVVEKYEKTEDDKKALPQDLEIPLRFQLPNKKKKKNRNRDIDIMDAVQKHLSNIRKIQEENESALGQNPGDEQPHEPKAQTKSKKDKNKNKRDKPSSEKKNRTEAIVIEDSGSSEDGQAAVNVDERIETTSKESEKLTGKRTKAAEKDGKSDAIVIGSSDDEKPTAEKRSFKPYDYSTGTKQLLEGDKTQQKKDYFNPMGQMKKHKGSKAPKNKGQMKQASKSFTFRR